MTPMLFALAFLASLFLLEGVYRVRLGSQHERATQVKDRLRDLARRKRGRVSESSEDSMVRAATRGGELLGSLELTLARAGSTQSVARFLLVSLALALAGFMLLMIVAGTPLRAAPGLAAGILPLFMTRRAGTKRMQKFAEQLPEGLELLTRSLRAGHALSSGFQLVGEELADPLGTEFAVVAEEQIGRAHV